MKNTFEKVKEIIEQNRIGQTSIILTPLTRFEPDLVDGTRGKRLLISEINSVFKLNISIEEFIKIQIVDDMVNFIDTKLAIKEQLLKQDNSEKLQPEQNQPEQNQPEQFQKVKYQHEECQQYDSDEKKEKDRQDYESGASSKYNYG